MNHPKRDRSLIYFLFSGDPATPCRGLV